MSNRIFYLIALGIFLMSCNKKKSVLAPENLYNVDGQSVISSLINNKAGTISIIYGNELALKAARDTVSTHIPGEKYTMVTWNQKPMPHWYGTNMNGTMLSVETVTVLQGAGGKTSFASQYLTGAGQRTSKRTLDQSRVSFILNQRAAVYP